MSYCPLCAQRCETGICGCGFRRPLHPIERVRNSIKNRMLSLELASRQMGESFGIWPSGCDPTPEQDGILRATAAHDSQIAAFEAAMQYIDAEFGEEI